MIDFLFFLALQPISRKTECSVNLRYVQVVYNILYSSLFIVRASCVGTIPRVWSQAGHP